MNCPYGQLINRFLYIDRLKLAIDLFNLHQVAFAKFYSQNFHWAKLTKLPNYLANYNFNYFLSEFSSICV
jgi:hypothetical protein